MRRFGKSNFLSSCNLTYKNESGALNETYSDINATFGELCMQPDGRSSYPASTPGCGDYLIGEDCWLKSGAPATLRDMRNPLTCKLPSKYKGTNWHTDPATDQGGVHKNNGPAAMAFYLNW